MNFKQIKLLCLIMRAHLYQGLTLQCPTVDFHKEQTEFMLFPGCVLVTVLWQIVISSHDQLTQSSHLSLLQCHCGLQFHLLCSIVLSEPLLCGPNSSQFQP